MLKKYSKTFVIAVSAFMMVAITINANTSTTVGTSLKHLVYENSTSSECNAQMIPQLMTLDGFDGKGRDRIGLIEGYRRQYLLGGPVPQILNELTDLSIFDR